MLSDIEIAENAELKDIREVAAQLSLTEDELELYGKYKAKLSLPEGLPRKAKLVLVTAINPTASGEGKTTVSIGLADGMKKLGKKVCLALREPSLGPVFGIKGGAAGGGYAQVCPCQTSTCTSRGICTRLPRRTISSARSWTIIFSAATS